MNDFKIRCWIPENNYMLYSDKLSENECYCMYFGDDRFVVEYCGNSNSEFLKSMNVYKPDWNIVESIPMRSLYHVDKNNKEIYEYDIVKFDSGRICEVVWFEAPGYIGWDLKSLNLDGYSPIGYGIWNSFVIIGNRFENEELYDAVLKES